MKYRFFRPAAYAVLSFGLICMQGSFAFSGEGDIQLAKTGKLLLSEDFSSGKLPDGWTGGGKAFRIVEGALQGVCQPTDTHGPACGVPVGGSNVTISFRFKYETPGYFLFLLDGESRYGGSAHLLRVSLAPGQTVLAQDRGDLKSKMAQKKLKDAAAAAGKKPPVPTKEELADPAFYRIEKLASSPAKFNDGQWHNVLIEQNGNDVLVHVDDRPPLAATGTVLDAEKSRIVFLVGQSGTVQIDDVKVWENTREKK